MEQHLFQTRWERAGFPAANWAACRAWYRTDFHDKEELTMSAGWIRVASLGDIEEGGTLQVGVAGEPVCLYKIGGQVFATTDICTHRQASLSEGFVDGDCIECPLHQALFHIP